MVKINVDARRAITIIFFEPQIFTDFTDVCYALEWEHVYRSASGESV